MKKEINFLMVYFFTVLVAVIIAITVEREDPGVQSTVVTKAVFDEPDVDWTDIDNPKKKAYLEHLYNSSNE